MIIWTSHQPLLYLLAITGASAALDISPIGEAKLDISGSIPKLEGIIDASTLLDSDLNSESLEIQLLSGSDPVTYQAAIVSEGSSWHGEQMGDGTFGSANFYVSDEGRLSGSITFDDKVCSIATYPDGELQVHFTCINLGDFPPDLEPVNGTAVEGEQEPVSTLGGNELDYIDVMVVYTTRAMCGEAGKPYPCDITEANKKPIEDRAALAVVETNAAYDMSGVTTGHMRLVHAYLDPNYDDSPEPFDPYKALDDLSIPNDGKLDEAHELREQYGADLVALWIDDLNGCGLAHVFTGSPSRGFSVMQRDCTTGFYTFGHELAHNQGCQHNRYDSKTQYADDFGHAWRDFDDNMRTIVAYECDLDTNEFDVCPKVQRFSTIRAKWQGLALGNEANDNVRKIEQTWDAVASFMPMTNGAVEAEEEPVGEEPEGSVGIYDIIHSVLELSERVTELCMSSENEKVRDFCDTHAHTT